MLAPVRSTSAPVGIFDSGVGGLSVLREIRVLLPREQLIYFADCGNAPYGSRPDAEVQSLSMAACEWLIGQGVKALLLACNTATAQIVAGLRAKYPKLPIVGVEPGIKPGALASQTKKVGVLATASTLSSTKFQTLLAGVREHHHCEFLCQAGLGLVELIEQGKADSPEVDALLHRYLEPMLESGVDTLVLGCTHYPFMDAALHRVLAQRMRLIDTGPAVAKQLARKLEEHHLGANADAAEGAPVRIVSIGTVAPLRGMVQELLRLEAVYSEISLA
ncbi:MAG: glutamate racemase [Candidatus Protistobacter heckmanni]|nr:glutamate racemase [Candidatus Protistobacter heckmanni]